MKKTYYSPINKEMLHVNKNMRQQHIFPKVPLHDVHTGEFLEKVNLEISCTLNGGFSVHKENGELIQIIPFPINDIPEIIMMEYHEEDLVEIITNNGTFRGIPVNNYFVGKIHVLAIYNIASMNLEWYRF